MKNNNFQSVNTFFVCCFMVVATTPTCFGQPHQPALKATYHQPANLDINHDLYAS